MANDVNLGTYHDLFFKLGGCEKTADEFSALTDPKEIDAIKEKYSQWVAKYINVDEKNPPKEGLPNDIEAENKYFQTREDEVANAPKEEKAAKRQDLNKEYDKAGWKKIQVGIAPAHSTPIAKIYHYNPNDPEYKGKSEEELRAIFTEKLREDMGLADNQDKPKEDENKNDNNTLDVKEGEEKADTPVNQDENQDWKDEKEKFWKEHCGEREQECERDPEDKEGLSLNISKEGQKLGSVRYSDSKHASISGENGKTADYSVFLGIVKDAKRNNQAINFSGDMSPEFAAKLKLACEELGVQYQNAPKGKIDANSFADELSDESKKKLEEYNAKQDANNQNSNNQDSNKTPYEQHLEQFKKDIAEGKGMDLSGITDEKDKTIAYAAAMVAAKDAQKDDIEIKGAPEKTIGYKNEKNFALDENGNIKKDESGKAIMEDNPLYGAVQGLPEEAKAALEGHNQGVRQKQLENARNRVMGTHERTTEAARRQEFRDNNHQYDESSAFNSKADREARQAAMQKYWENQRSNG